MFYPGIKTHISPSAFASWFEGHTSFIKTYFGGSKFKESAAMRSGKKIHALIEAGLLTVNNRYEVHEVPLCLAIFKDLRIKFIAVRMDWRYEFPADAPIAVFGVPDSYQLAADANGVIRFVDYKSGKENAWDNKELAIDLKMKMTAWLVYQRAKLSGSVARKVVGFIEHIPTEWNPETRQIEPTGGESVVAGEWDYTAEELEALTPVILKTVEEINAEYEEYLTSTDEFVNQDDVAAYAELYEQVDELEGKMEIILDRIGQQMVFGGRSTASTVFGTFYFKKTNHFSYPPTLPVRVDDDSTITLEQGLKVEAAIAAAKKRWQIEKGPESSTKSVQFKPKKK